MSWSTRRRLIIVLIILLAVSGAASFFILPYFLKDPTCSDGKKNGGESGVDCGGPCSSLCAAEVAPLKLIWTRPFKATAGIYDVLAYVENHNIDAAAKKIIYKFSLYDESNVLVATRVGKTYVTPNGKIPVFEGNIRTGERVPRRAFFEVSGTPEWIKAPPKAITLSLGTRNITYEVLNGKSVVSATIFNPSSYSIANVEVTAILYDDKRNAFAVSKTLLESVGKDSTRNVTFTWPSSFESEPARIEIIPRFDVFSVPF